MLQYGCAAAQAQQVASQLQPTMIVRWQVVKEGSLMLMDAGCERHGYASDITRTWPISGRFSSAQRAVYNVVLAAHRCRLFFTWLLFHL